MTIDSAPFLRSPAFLLPYSAVLKSNLKAYIVRGPFLSNRPVNYSAPSSAAAIRRTKATTPGGGISLSALRTPFLNLPPPPLTSHFRRSPLWTYPRPYRRQTVTWWSSLSLPFPPVRLQLLDNFLDTHG